MLDLLKFEYKRILTSKVIIFMLAYAVVCPLFLVVFGSFLINLIGDESVSAFSDLSSSQLKIVTWFVTSYFYERLPLVMALFSPLFVGRDYKDGVIRNKITAGHKRIEIFASVIITQVSVVVVLSVIYVVVGLVALACSDFGVNTNDGEMILRFITLLLSLIGMTVLFTTLAMIIKSRAGAVVISVVFVMSLSLIGTLAKTYSYSYKSAMEYIDLCEEFYEDKSDMFEEFEEDYDYSDLLPEKKDVINFGWFIGHSVYMLTNASMDSEFISSELAELDYPKYVIHDGYASSIMLMFTGNYFPLDEDTLEDIDGYKVKFSDLMMQYNIKSIVWIAVFVCGGYAIFRKKDLN